PDTSQTNDANKKTFGKFHPAGNYFGTPIKLSNNLVVSGSNVRGGVFHRDSALIYEFMPVDLEVDDTNKSLRSIELVMVIDYGFGEILDGHGREWDYDITSPTS
ncbi:hypothetical protein, partial [Streptococcus pseudopneumoniae]|uniref:hypothetical protein n=1 Tax=Streptococcus pseudopneumoniae TaxID=257758 RepID=UPI0014864A62